MPLKVLSLDNLPDLDDGKIAEAFRVHLARAAHDCYDRPGDGKPRKVTLEIGLFPVLESDGSCDQVKLQALVTSAVPKHRTKVLSLGLKPNANLLFNPDSLENVDQATFLPGDDA